MAVHHICDGCGERIEGDDFEKVGHVIGRDYCAACTALARDYLTEIDTVHTEAAQHYSEGVLEVKAKFSATLKLLPDHAA